MKVSVILLAFFSFTTAYSQFSEEWLGKYQGTLYIEFPDGNKDSLFLQLEFLKTQSPYRWTQKFLFQSEKYGEIIKDYELVFDESYTDGRHYYLDEKNGIEIDEIFMNNTFYGQYEVLNAEYTSQLRKLENGHLYYELVCSRPNGRKTQSEMDEKGEKFNVKSSLVFTVQYAILKPFLKN